MSTWTDAGWKQHVAECIEEVDYRWHQLRTAKTLPDQGQAALDLGNAVHDLRTWHPGYDEDRMTLPWERDDEDAT